jgi:hypothetical protein
MTLEENDQLWLSKIEKPTEEDYETKLDHRSEDPPRNQKRELNQVLTVMEDTTGPQIVSQVPARRRLGH